MSIFKSIYYRDALLPDHSSRLEQQFHLEQKYFDGRVCFHGSSFNNQLDLQVENFFRDQSSELVVIGEVELTNTSELVLALRFRYNGRSSQAELALVLEAYKKWGKECVQHMNGQFAFGIWDKQQQEFFCGRDQLGHKPFFFALTNEVFAFSNRIESLFSKAVSNELNSTFVLNYLQQLCSAKDATVFKHVYRLLPGHTLTIKKESSSLRRYWKIGDKNPATPKNIKEAVEGLRWHLHNAVKAGIKNTSRLAIELSAGIDSSAIAAIICKYIESTENSMVAFTNVLPKSHRSAFANFRDEWDSATHIAKYIGIAEHIAIDSISHDPLALLEKSLSITGYPINNFFTLHQLSLYTKMREEGRETIFSGFGGNEVVTEFANFSYINNLMKKGAIFDLGKFFHRQGEPLLRSSLKAAYHYSKYLLKIQRWTVWHDKFVKQDWKNLVLRDDFLNNVKLKRAFFDQGYYPPYQTVREETVYRLEDSNLVERLEAGYFYTSSFNLNYAYPLLHIPLIEYYFSLKDEWKALNRNGRGLFRAAVSDILPKEVVEQKKFGLTNNTPYLKVSFGRDFNKLKQYCLDLPNSNNVFLFVDKKKIQRMESKIEDSNMELYSLLEHVLLMGLFMEKQKQLVNHVVH